jgi:hypothetical protein
VLPFDPYGGAGKRDDVVMDPAGTGECGIRGRTAEFSGDDIPSREDDSVAGFALDATTDGRGHDSTLQEHDLGAPLR